MAADAVLQEAIPVAAITTVDAITDVVTDVVLPFGAATTAASGLFYCFCSAVTEMATMAVAAATAVAVACLAVTAMAAATGLSGLS